MNICFLTPDRGDREILTAFCGRQVERMHDAYGNHVLLNGPPIGNNCDIVTRVRWGSENCRVSQRLIEAGSADTPWKVGITRYDWAFIIENDDYYPADYIKNLLPLLDGLDFIGYQNTFYYNIKTRRYSRLEHETHSSLFCTGFRLSALDDFEWPPDDYTFLDIALWKHAKQSGKNWKLLRTDNPCVGIKGHGMGKMGGKGHRMELMRADPEMKWFREKLNDEEAFKFYQSIV